MKKIKLCFIGFLAFYLMLSLKCNFGKSKNRTDPPSGSKTVKFYFPRPEEQTIYPLRNIDFINGPCSDILEPTTFTVTVRVFYIDNNGDEINYGALQRFQNVTMPPSGDILLDNVEVPTGGEYFVQFFYTMDKCSPCCGFAYLHSKVNINEGCEATLATMGIEQGKPQIMYGLNVQKGNSSTLNYFADNVEYFSFRCYCDCL